MPDLGILDLLDTISDPRRRHDIRHRFVMILALSLAATCTGARSFTPIAEWIHDVPHSALSRLGAVGARPSESTIRRTLGRVDAGCWTGCSAPRHGCAPPRSTTDG
ncbi:transposase family protein [Rhodococcus ruber]|uniref:transposase family protein n=1 Tax=Rhodococcus ruber TaxID=1830 RepID=UPI001C11416B|nr:transposase family protein [Rhodococcus ruber]